MAYGERLETRQSGFKHTSNVVSFRLATVCVTEMCFDPCNPVAKSADGDLISDDSVDTFSIVTAHHDSHRNWIIQNFVRRYLPTTDRLTQ